MVTGAPSAIPVHDSQERQGRRDRQSMIFFVVAKVFPLLQSKGALGV
jgi:hypothetical protein